MWTEFTWFLLTLELEFAEWKKGEMWGQFVAISGSLLALALFCATLVFLSVCGKLSPLAFELQKEQEAGNIKSKIGLWSSVINGRIFFSRCGATSDEGTFISQTRPNFYDFFLCYALSVESVGKETGKYHFW